MTRAETIIDVRALGPADARAFQALRLQGLVECPAAFASSYDEERDLALSVVAERLGSREGRATFGAFRGAELVGVVGIVRETHRKLAHKAFIWGMYVAPASRRRGVARRLVARTLAFAQSGLRVRQVSLGVNAENGAALALYASMGFTAYGREPCFMLVDGLPQDEVLMVCVLPPAP